MKEFIITREKVEFWLDENGTWQNRHGPFRHKRIIDHFHQSIRRDESGYYLLQAHGDRVREKVYFPYRDTALFVFEVIDRDGELRAVLNTRATIVLDPESLFVEKDRLYMHNDGHRIRFTSNALLTISECLRLEDEKYQIVINGRTVDIPRHS